jgi:transcription initiation factor TFIID subunit 5
VVYKGHNYPVWDVEFGPYGFYFATASHDRTARLWSCDHIHPLRIFAGHLSDVDTVKFHPNSKYLVTGSSDRTARLWDVQKGTSVRVFAGHQGSVKTVAVSPDGKLMASAGKCVVFVSSQYRRGHPYTDCLYSQAKTKQSCFGILALERE